MTIFDGETFEVILERMLARLPSDIDKREGSVVYDLLAPKALELAQSYMELDNVLDLGFADSTYGEYLDRKVAEQGLARKEAVKATGSLTFTGLDGYDLPVGTRVSTLDSDAIYFVTTEDATFVDGTATVAAEAEVGGVTGNVNADEIVDVTASDSDGVISVTNTSAFSGGVDEETDELLFSRYQEYVTRPITSGNKYQYELWAKEINGVSSATCYPLWNGAGTVKVVLVNEEKRSPAQSVINEVAAHIEEQRPVGATVTVVGVTEVPIDVAATVTLTDGADIATVTASIISNITTYLKSIAFVETTVRYTQVGNAILDADGVIDYTDLRINGAVTNIPIQSDAVPIMGALSVN